MDTKHCRKCDTTKSVEEFNRAKSSTDGLQHWCRSCQRAQHHKTRDMTLEKQSEYRQRNRDTLREKSRAYHHQHRDEIREQSKGYRQKNRDKIHAYYWQNRDAALDQKKAHYQQNRDEILEKKRSRSQLTAAHWADHDPYSDHQTGTKECRRNHGALPVYEFSRDATRKDGLNLTCKKCDNTIGETRSDRAAWTHLSRTRPPCFYCGNSSRHIDHVAPVSRGGRDVAANYLPACSLCNLSKNASWVYNYLFGAEGTPDADKPAHYQTWNAPFLLSLFQELEHSADARP